MRRLTPFPTDDHAFGLCLTHDVDRPYKGLQALYYAVADRSGHHLEALRPGSNPWWQFDRIMEIEDAFGVRSAFYFLQEQALFLERDVRESLKPLFWIEHLGRYDPQSPDIVSVVEQLAAGGWEVGLHGSIGSHRDTDRLAAEKRAIEAILEDDVVGVRQHHLRLDVPETWERHAAVGLSYDTSLGSATEMGFQHGYYPFCPFDDRFVVFPLTVMDKAVLVQADTTEARRDRLRELLQTAREEHAVMTVLWHPQKFTEADFPGLADLYRDLIEMALEMDGWVGPPAALYDRLELEGRA